MREIIPATKERKTDRTLTWFVSAKFWIEQSHGLLAAAAIFGLAVFLTVKLSASFGYSDISYMSSGGATLALAAMGAAIVIISGGFDLSVGAVISLVNVVLTALMRDDVTSQILVAFGGLAVGGAVGAFNGFLVAYGRLQPIVVTLSSMFIAQGITLLIRDTPGGQLPPEFSSISTGDAVPHLIPASAAVVLAAALLWRLLKNSRYGTALYAVGSDERAALYAGVNVTRIRFYTYLLAGVCYGAAGVMVSAQTGFGDPLIGSPLLLSVFAAVVIGGTVLGGGRGGCVGPMIGAYTIMLIVNLLLVLNVSAYYSTVATGVLLLIAALAGVAANGEAGERRGILRWPLWHRRRRMRMSGGSTAGAASIPKPSWRIRHQDLLRYATPSYVCFLCVVVATVIIFRRFDINYLNSLVVLGTFLTILALGQGAVVLAGGLDLSIPWTITLCGILFTNLAEGTDFRTLWVVPVVLAVGAAIGLLNGVVIVLFSLPPIVVTLAMNGIIQGAALLYSNGAAAIGIAPLSVRWLMTGKVFGVTPAIFLTMAFVVFSTVLLTQTTFGRRVYAVGNSRRVARLSGVSVGTIVVLVYMLSGICSALVGILFCGFSGQASLDMGQEYLLASITVVVVGGTLITGGRGHYLGMIGGVLLLTALQTLLSGTTLPMAVRGIIFGVVVLIAVVTLRDRAKVS